VLDKQYSILYIMCGRLVRREIRVTRKAFGISTAAIAVALAVVVAWSIVAGNFIVPLVAVVLAAVLSHVLRKATKEVTADERTSVVYEKASGATVKLSVPAVGLVAVILLALKERLSADMVSVAYALAYTACGLLLVHWAFYSYYSRKH
jgi:uncharacterized membrane protein